MDEEGAVIALRSLAPIMVRVWVWVCACVPVFMYPCVTVHLCGCIVPVCLVVYLYLSGVRLCVLDDGMPAVCLLCTCVPVALWPCVRMWRLRL